jgi:hypothetical protein
MQFNKPHVSPSPTSSIDFRSKTSQRKYGGKGKNGHQFHANEDIAILGIGDHDSIAERHSRAGSDYRDVRVKKEGSVSKVPEKSFHSTIQIVLSDEVAMNDLEKSNISRQSLKQLPKKLKACLT